VLHAADDPVLDARTERCISGGRMGRTTQITPANENDKRVEDD